MATKKYVSLEKLGLYNEKIKKVISDSDAVVLDEAKAYADGLATNYDEAGAAATVQGKLDEEVIRAKAREDEIGAANVATQKEVDDLEKLVGTLPESATATDIVGYVQEKTSGIATSENLAELTERVAQAETDIDNIEKDYLKSADKTELSNLISAEQTRATGIESGLRTDVDAIKKDYLKTSDKEELQGNIDTVDALVDTLIGADTGKSARTIANEELAKQLIAEGAQESLDTLAEIAAWIQSHPDDAAAMNKAIEDLEALVGTLPADVTATTIVGYVQEIVAAEVATEKERAEGIEAGLTERIEALETSVGDGGSVEDMISEAVADAIDTEVARVDGLLENKVDKVTGKGLSTNDLTNELKANYDDAYAHSQVAHAPANAQENVIETVKVNGTAVTVTGKAVDIAVPTDNTELTNGAGYLVANDIVNKANKATTLAGYGISDAYTTAQTDTAIANAVGQFEECSEAEINALFA